MIRKNINEYLIVKSNKVVVDVYNTLGTLIDTETVVGDNDTITIADGLMTIKDVNGNVIQTELTPATANTVAIVPDGKVTLNGLPLASISPTEIEDYFLVDQDGNPVLYTQTGNVLEVDTETPVDVTINGITVVNDAVTDVDLTLKDQDGNDVAFTQTGNDLEVTISTMFTHIINVDGVQKSNLTLDALEDNIINVNLYS